MEVRERGGLEKMAHAMARVSKPLPLTSPASTETITINQNKSAKTFLSIKYKINQRTVRRLST